MPEPCFGRRYSPDDRDRRYGMRLMLDPLRSSFFPQGLPPGTRHYRSGPILNQGPTGCCVAFGWTARANGAPIMQVLSLEPYDLYRKIVADDEYPDNDQEATAPDDQLQSGTSVRAGAKVLQALGYLQQYLWAESVEDVRAWHLAGFGGCVLGTTWFTGMMTTDTAGFVTVSGHVEGGHCFASHGWNDKVRHNGRYVRALRCQQSWGIWGEGGFFWLEEGDLAKLIADQGEVCAPVERRVVVPA